MLIDTLLTDTKTSLDGNPNAIKQAVSQLMQSDSQSGQLFRESLKDANINVSINQAYKLDTSENTLIDVDSLAHKLEASEHQVSPELLAQIVAQIHKQGLQKSATESKPQASLQSAIAIEHPNSKQVTNATASQVSNQTLELSSDESSSRRAKLGGNQSGNQSGNSDGKILPNLADNASVKQAIQPSQAAMHEPNLSELKGSQVLNPSLSSQSIEKPQLNATQTELQSNSLLEQKELTANTKQVSSATIDNPELKTANSDTKSLANPLIKNSAHKNESNVTSSLNVSSAIPSSMPSSTSEQSITEPGNKPLNSKASNTAALSELNRTSNAELAKNADKQQLNANMTRQSQDKLSHANQLEQNVQQQQSQSIKPVNQAFSHAITAKANQSAKQVKNASEQLANQDTTKSKAANVSARLSNLAEISKELDVKSINISSFKMPAKPIVNASGQSTTHPASAANQPSEELVNTKQSSLPNKSINTEDLELLKMQNQRPHVMNSMQHTLSNGKSTSVLTNPAAIDSTAEQVRVSEPAVTTNNALAASSAIVASSDTAVSEVNRPTLAQTPLNLTNKHWDNKLAEKVSIMALKGQNFAKINLDPPELGPMVVKIQQSANETQVQIQAQNPVTRDLLDNHAQRLKELLEAQGFAQVNVDVSQEQQTNQSKSDQQGINDDSGSVDQNSTHLANDNSTQTQAKTNNYLIDLFA